MIDNQSRAVEENDDDNHINKDQNNILEHLDVSKDISRNISSLLGFMAKIHPNLEIYH